jgi:hypothetical protein
LDQFFGPIFWTNFLDQFFGPIFWTNWTNFLDQFFWTNFLDQLFWGEFFIFQPAFFVSLCKTQWSLVDPKGPLKYMNLGPLKFKKNKKVAGPLKSMRPNFLDQFFGPIGPIFWTNWTNFLDQLDQFFGPIFWTNFFGVNFLSFKQL